LAASKLKLPESLICKTVTHYTDKLELWSAASQHGRNLFTLLQHEFKLSTT